MSQPGRAIDSTQAGTSPVLWALIALYAVARVSQLFAGRIPMLAIVSLHVLPPALFALVHGARFYGFRDGVSAAGNILLAIPLAGLSLLSDATGARWKVGGITGVCALVSIFTMSAFAVLAWVRLRAQSNWPRAMPSREGSQRP